MTPAQFTEWTVIGAIVCIALLIALAYVQHISAYTLGSFVETLHTCYSEPKPLYIVSFIVACMVWPVSLVVGTLVIIVELLSL